MATIEYKERNEDIVRRKMRGQSLAQIGREYGITRERVRQIVDRTTEEDGRDDELWERLRTTAEREMLETVLTRAYHVAKKAEAECGQPFSAIPREKWGGFRNCGEATLNLLYKAFPEGGEHEED